MVDVNADAVPKVHPATREILPDDPMEMHALEVPGDPDLMLRLLVEEYARIGLGVHAIVQLAREPNYTAFYALRISLGEEAFRARVGDIIRRCGVIRVSATETEPPAENLVQIALPVS
jgi:hypothetical protein